MKKRLLSVMLLLAMLITAVPVMVSAEVDATVLPENATSMTDLHNYYVQDGLTALFTTFGDNAGVDLTAGTWTDRIGGKVATLGKSTQWKEGEQGGIGFTVVYGIMTDGSFGTGYNLNANDKSLKLDFGIAMLPTSDFSVEYLAKYKPVYVAADTKGTLATDASGNPLETFSVNHSGGALGGVSGAAGSGWAIDHFGWYSTYTNNIDGRYDGLARGDVFWCFDAPGWYFTNAGGNSAMNRRHYDFKKDTSFSRNNEIHTYGVYLDETLHVDAEGNRTTTAALSLWRDALKHADNATSLNSTANPLSQCNGWYDIDTPYRADLGFSLSAARPTDFFAVRIYDRALTDVEKHRNHAVDVLLYYGISLPASVLEDETTMSLIYSAVGNLAIETDAVKAAAAKALIADEIAEAVVNADLLQMYAASENMTSFFSVYAKDTLDVTAGKWADVVGGGYATMPTASRWFQNADGSFGYNVFVGYVDENGNPSALGTTVTNDKAAVEAAGISSLNHAYNKENYLNIGIGKLPTEDYTVEYLAKYRPVLVADAAKSTASEVVYAKDASGKLLEAYHVFGKTPATTDYGTSKRGVDTIGWYTNYTQSVDSVSGWNATRGALHWCYDNFTWGTHNGYWVYSAWGNGGLNIAGNAFQTNDLVRTYGIYVDETYNSETGVTSAVFGMYRDAVRYNDNAAKPQTTECLSDTTRYYTEFGSGCQFYLSAARPTDFYSVRVYDRILTDDEKKQNRAVDVILYYGLDVSSAREDAEIMKNLYSLFSAETLATDASAKAARAAALQAVIDGMTHLIPRYAASEHMTSFFTTYVSASVDLKAGKWTDLITGKTATLATSAKWSVGEYGGIGFNAYYGMIDAEGTFTTTSNYNYYNKVDMRLDFGVSFLPADDFTVEYMAMYKPIYVTDVNGDIAIDANGKRIETYNANGNTPGGMAGTVGWPVDFIGFFQAFTNNVDGSYSGWGRSGLCWFFNNGYWYNGRNGKRMGLYKSSDAFQKNDVIGTYGIYVDESYDAAADVTSAVLGLYRNGVDYANNADTPNSTANASDSTFAYFPQGKDYSDFNFWLSASRPTDFFTVRIYDKVLTQEEREQNRAVDLILYYALTLTDEMWADESLMASIYSVLSGVEFVKDPTAKAAKALALQDSIDQLVTAIAMRELYARGDDLTALYTVYAASTVNLTAGTWTDLIGGKKATFKTPARWSQNANGSVGFNVFYGMIGEDGAFTTTSNYNYTTTKDYNISLSFGISALPTEDFTVEYMAMYKPVYVATTTGAIAKNAETGAFLESYDFGGAPTGHTGTYGEGMPVDYLGRFQSYTNKLDGSPWSGGRASVHWLYNNHRWTSGNNGAWVGGGAWGASGGLNISGNAFQKNNVIQTYGIYLDETYDAATDVTTALFGLYRAGAHYKNNASALNTTTGTGGAAYDASAYPSTAEFYLSCSRPTDFFTVRIYDVALSADDQLQNYFVDMLYYYGIDIPAELSGNTEALLTLANELTSLGMATGASEKAANKAAIETAITALTKTVTVQVGSAVLDTLVVVGDKLTLPTVVGDKLAIGWRVAGVSGNVAPGTEISVSDGMTLAPVLFTIPATRLAPDVKVATSAEDLAVRFTAELYRADYVALCKMYGAENITLGMLITPDAYVQMTGGVFTREALTAMVKAAGSTSGAAYVEVVADGFYQVGTNVLTVAGSLYHFKGATYTKNPEFAAVAFIDVDTDADGKTDFTVYGSYDQKASASVKDAMTSARENLTNTQKEWIDSLLSKFGA